MTRSLLALALALAIATPALAHNCPALIAQIEEALASESASLLPADTVTAATAMLEEGRKLHDEGLHDASMQTLEAAKMILGLTE